MAAIDYLKTPAPITIYYSEPQDSAGRYFPVLTDGGDLMVVGGILHQNNNYDVAQTAFLLHVNNEATGSWPLRVWIVFDSVLLLFTTIIIIVMLLRNRKHETQKESTQNSGEIIV